MKKLHEKHFLCLLFGLSIAIILIIIRVAGLWEMRIKSRNLSDYTAADPQSFEYSLEKNEFVFNKQENKYIITISGWLALYGKDNAPIMIQTIIHNDNDIAYELPTEVSKREDVNEKIGDGFDHTWSGFFTKVACPGDIHVEEGDYEVSFLLTVDGTEYLINTEERITSGE
ncbi:hypothetical protein [Butyrivibrio sp. AE3004]|uniref:hypothetical protein n=1 Tax=Butyrivibrio sp. AE3004 TaxID=1506994 RepID=UPI0004942BBD|nr:hypothetical protein [Butyrivibrio sp. AE3004]